MKKLFETHKSIVSQDQLDHMGHMNVRWYTAKFDEATWIFFAHLGITPEYIKNNDRGMAAVEQTIKYKKEALLGDILIIKSELIEVTKKKIRLTHHMLNFNQDLTLSTTDVTAIHIDRTLRKSCEFPSELYQNIQKFLP